MRRRAVYALLALAAAGALPSAATASQLITRHGGPVRLRVSRSAALVSYRSGGKTRYVRASGAINAIAPTPGRVQVAFRIKRSTKKPRFRGRCRRVQPAIPNLVTSCLAPDGSLWALQRWQRSLPNYGAEPTRLQALPDLRLSHWRGETAVLTLKADWSFGGRFEHVYGSLTYLGQPVYGFTASRTGTPDSFGRNVYLDTLDPGYGPGWKRENSFLTHRPFGNFCYDFVANQGRESKGSQYRAMVVGPGVTPDVGAQVASPGPYDPERDQAANAEQALLAPGDRLCRPS